MSKEKILDYLNNLKFLGCVGIKTSFEDEGAQLNEIMTLRYLTALLGLELSIKIGGGEAKRDITDCLILNCDSIVAPMIESNFALSKYLEILKNNEFKGKKGFNLETISAYHNLETTRAKPSVQAPQGRGLENMNETLKNIDFIVFGRVDFVSSLGKDRNFVESNEMYDYVSNVFKLGKLQGKKCYLGGAISKESNIFIETLIKENLLDRFETRYIIFDANKVDLSKFNELIYNATLFELEWLKYIQNRYLSYANKDNKRILMIEERCKVSKNL